MKLFIYILTAYFFFFSCLTNVGSVYAQNRGVFLKNATSEEKKKQLMSQPGIVYKKSWAVIIGINNYYEWPQLRYACNDAREFRKVLIEDFGFNPDNIMYLIDEPYKKEKFNAIPTRDNIKMAFENLFDKNLVSREDRVIVFFAGHGYTKTLPDGNKKGYLIPIDGKKDKLYVSSISMDDIKVWSESIPAKHILYLIDACYSGLAMDSYRGLSLETEDFVHKITEQPVRFIITAGQEDEQVIERADLHHSVFSYKLLEGLRNNKADLNNDFIIHSYELGNYLFDEVTKLSEDRQTPEFGVLEGKGAVVMVKPEVFNDFNLFAANNAYKTFDNIETFLKNNPNVPYSVAVSLMNKFIYKYPFSPAKAEMTNYKNNLTKKYKKEKKVQPEFEFEDAKALPKWAKKKEKKKGILKKWWFWTLVAGAGGALAIAVNDDKSSDASNTGNIKVTW